jgi:hypothetical protein
VLTILFNFFLDPLVNLQTFLNYFGNCFYFSSPPWKLSISLPLRKFSKNSLSPSEISCPPPEIIGIFFNPLRNLEKMFDPLEIKKTIFDPFGNFP